VDADPADATTPMPAAEPEPQPEPLDDEAQSADEKRAAQARAWDLWLDCHDDRTIGELMGIPKSTASDYVSGFRRSADFGQPPESRQHFDVWQFATADKDAGQTRNRHPARCHPGPRRSASSSRHHTR